MSSEKAVLEEKPPNGGVYPPEDPEKVIEGTFEDYEVFKQTTDGVNFRTVGWPRASVIFLKVRTVAPHHLHHPDPS